jgi:hypothetical protein
MSFHQKLALSIFVPCAIVALANALAFRAFPERWGGPNIGGGFIQLIAYAGMAAGAVLFIVGTAKRRQHRSTR